MRGVGTVKRFLGGRIRERGVLVGEDPEGGGGACQLSHLSQIDPASVRSDSCTRHAPPEPRKHRLSLLLSQFAKRSLEVACGDMANHGVFSTWVGWPHI